MNSIQLDMRHHELLVAIAEEGSLTGATRRLHLSTSALSHQLRDAEERLGTPLFQRRHRRLLLTAAGEHFVDGARRVLAEVHAATRSAAARGLPRDLLRLSTECYTCYGWLAPVMGLFSSRHP